MEEKKKPTQACPPNTKSLMSECSKVSLGLIDLFSFKYDCSQEGMVLILLWAH